MDLTHYLSGEQLIAKRDQIKRIFFYRVCGTGMGAAACLLKEKGLHIEGGDTQFYPPMSDYLKSTGIPCHNLKDFDVKRLSEFDLIVVGNVVPRKSEDAALIEKCGVKFCSFPAALGAFVLKDANVVGVAGTHGKTTTTYFATQMFEKLGQDPGYLIGGVMEGRPSAKLGGGKYFFIESDEYDSCYFEKFSKFQSYEIDHLILTSLEFDHADIFKDLDAIKLEFRNLFAKVTQGITYCSDYQPIIDLHNENLEHYKNLYWQSYGDKDQRGPKILEVSDKGTVFELQGVRYKSNVVGIHNILNLSSVILFALNEGFTKEQIDSAISDLKMVRRRQELRGYYQGTPVIDDFAHHPKAVELTLQGLKLSYPGRKLLVVMEANSATARSNIFQNEFEQALHHADEVLFAKPARPTSVSWAGNLDIEAMAKNLTAINKSSLVIENLQTLRMEIDKRLTDQSLLVVLSNGTCLGLWESDFVQALKA
ncbi:MAG: hypothetical protein CME71_10720 [Halobacteriovorax sp.]|nr:hypothetical protein [Halobacteriovorax sp.]